MKNVVEWPTSKGIWMGKIKETGWFPMKAKLLKKYPEGEKHLPMPIIVQYPQSETKWPWTFQGCHPVNEWREPSEQELAQAKHYYRMDQ